MRGSMLFGALAAAAFATAAVASPVAGVWRAPVHNADIEVYDCGPAVCGRVINSDLLRAHPDMKDVHNGDVGLRDRQVKGLQMIRGFTGGPDKWKGGEIYNPDDGHTYHGTITLADPDTLKLTGCVVFPLCQTQVWHRQR
ncbi:MAG: DUF2147 domain-containing protein [Caulobacteraceae bacterium]